MSTMEIKPSDLPAYKGRFISIKYSSGASITGKVLALFNGGSYYDLDILLDPEGDDGAGVNIILNDDRYEHLTIETVTEPPPTELGTIIKLLKGDSDLPEKYIGQHFILQSGAGPFSGESFWKSLDGKDALFKSDILDFETIDLDQV